MFLDLYARGKTFAWSVRDRLGGKEDGAVATEYGLLLVLIALAIIVAATALGLAISGVFTRASGSLGTTS